MPDRWADVSSDEETGEVDAVKLASEESYREAPAAGFEDFAECTVPKDFGFLLGSGLSAKRGKDSSWRPNLCAPEFIPTLTMHCPVVAVQQLEYQGSAENGSLQDAWLRGRAASMAESSSDAGSAACSTPDTGSDHAGRKRRSGDARAMLLRSPQKRSKSEERKLQAILSLTPTLSSTAAPSEVTSLCASPRSSVAGPQASLMPEASEEEWQRRIVSRQKGIDTGKLTPEYLWLKEQQGFLLPRVPDPMDRSVSKRQWNWLVHEWRKQMLLLYTEAGSIVSQEARLEN